MIDEKQLIDLAVKAKVNAYAPYSKFRVGAALLADNGQVYLGCNIENISFGATCCAERTAIFKAVSEGIKGFSAIAIAADTIDDYIFPCGICRQVLAEFCEEDFVILCTRPDGDYKKYTIMQLLPEAFVKIEKR